MANSYREVLLTNQILQLASARASELPLYENSHRGRQANFVGCIGEVVFEQFLEKHGVRFSDQRHLTDRDYLVEGGLTCDVKTKDRTARPKIDYDNSVPLYNHEHQRPNFYYFVSLLRDPSIAQTDPRRFMKAFLLGGIDLPTLERIGIKWGQGETDPSNGTTFWTACINVKMRDLVSNSDLLAMFKTRAGT